MHVCLWVCVWVCVWAGLWAELSRHSNRSGWQPVGLHCSLPGRRGAVRWSRSTPQTTEILQYRDRRRQWGRQIKVIALRSDRRLSWSVSKGLHINARLQSHATFRTCSCLVKCHKILNVWKELFIVYIVCLCVWRAIRLYWDSYPPQLSLAISDRGYVYLGRHRGQHRPACCSLTHYYDILPPAKANTPIFSSVCVI